MKRFKPTKKADGWHVSDSLRPESIIGVVAKAYPEKAECLKKCRTLNKQ